VPRPPRPQIAGGIYHITSRGNRQTAIVVDDVDRRRFIAILDRTTRRCGWRCHAHCLLDNHYHLVVETPQPNISEGMHYLNLRYAKWFNRRHDLVGHVFQNRFYSGLVESDAHLMELARYVALNPVRAGACTAASSWRWSSYRATAGLERPPPFLTTSRLLAYFGTNHRRACAAFDRFVREGFVSRPN
jgi:REP-associated tyrosine transposase